MQNPELCKELLHRILPDLKIDRIEYPELQKTIKPDIDARRVRLDVYVKDNKNTVYDIEMQVSNTRELPERSRKIPLWRVRGSREGSKEKSGMEA